MKNLVIYILAGLAIGSATGWLTTYLKNTDEPLQLVSFADAVSYAAPSVVNIYTQKTTHELQRSKTNDPLLNFFFNQQNRRYKQKRELSLGSGVIVHKQGFILTNYHVIQDADEILVLLYDGRETLARVIGKDTETDLAVLQIDLPDLQPIKTGDLEKLRVGDPVLAIGNPYGFGQTVTAGIVSAMGRYGLNLNTYENFIQTDAAINNGSSGGALINGRGQLIGINTAMYSRSGGSQGIGLAIPIDIASKVLTDIIRHGEVIRGWLGLEVTQLNANIANRLGIQRTSGVVITNTYRQGPAEAAGLLPGDIIISIDNKKIVSGQDGLLEVANLQPGDIVRTEVIRNNQTQVIDVAVGTRPSLDRRR